MKYESEKTANFNKIYELDCFQKEFIKATDNELRYKKWLARKLAILDEKGSKAVILEEFEHLEYDKTDLYSIRYPKSKNNPRVIYFLIEDDNVILVTAFKEKSNKDYRQGIERAVKRYKMMM